MATLELSCEFMWFIIDKIIDRNIAYISIDMTNNNVVRQRFQKWRMIYHQVHPNLAMYFSGGRFHSLVTCNCLLTNYFCFHSSQNSFHFLTNELVWCLMLTWNAVFSPVFHYHFFWIFSIPQNITNAFILKENSMCSKTGIQIFIIYQNFLDFLHIHVEIQTLIEVHVWWI